MHYELQKASMPKRIAALLIDLILVAILATGGAWLLSDLLHYDDYANTVQQAYEKHGAEHGVDLTITLEAYNLLSAEEKEKVDAGFADMNADTEAVNAKLMLPRLILINASLSILFAIVVVEIVLPQIFKNGQTLGKKVFSLSVVRKDGIQINNIQLFVRGILGKYAIETMVLVYTFLMFYFNIQGIMIIPLLAMVVLVVQLGSLIFTANNCAIHDLMCGTVVVDHSSQMIFKSTDDLIAYQKKMAAERASRQPY